MSLFENNQYRWRETYFVLFESSRRPSLASVETLLSELSDQYLLTNLNANDAGLVESLTLVSPDDCSALDICYTSGAEVLEQGADMAQELQPADCVPGRPTISQQIQQCDARFDVLHFEQVPELIEEDEDEEMVDPGALLLVLAALARVTDGIAVDPQTGSLLSEGE
jgi:hypothetical protein